MRCAAVLLLGSLIVPLASATSLALGPVEAEVVLERMPECTVGVDEELCVATWKEGQDEGVSDDEINATRVAQYASVSVHESAAPEGTVTLEPRQLVLEHPLNLIVNETWYDANESRPELVAPYVSFDVRGNLTVITVNFPTPIPSPLYGGRPQERSYVPVYSWNCGFYFTTYASWNEACSYAAIRPLPNGADSRDDTDRLVALPADFLKCEDYEYLPEACPTLETGSQANLAAAEAWRNATPQANWGTGVEKVEAGVSHGNASRGPTGAAQGAFLSRLSKGDLAPSPRPRAGGSPFTPAENTLATGTTWTPPPSASPLIQTGKPVVPRVQSEHGTPILLIAAAVTAAGFLALLAVALYHRLTRSHVLKNENRRRIFDLIHQVPGIRAGTIAARLGLSHPTVAEHLRVLERFALLEADGDGQRRYFVAGSTDSSQRAAATASSSLVARAILDHLRQHGRADVSTLREALRLKRSTASMSLSRLEKAGLLVKRSAAGRVWVVLTSPAPAGNAQPGSVPAAGAS